MARDARLEIPGGTYHVMNRGNRKATIYEDDRDRRRFAAILRESSQEYRVEVLAGSQMGNHFHVVVVTPEGNISAFMDHLQGTFAQYSNWRHQRVGHLFQGRFRAVVVENDIHLLTALCYVFMNPVVAKLVSRMEEWKWSTYAATIGLAPAPTYLSLDWLDSLFPAATRQEAQRMFKALLEETQPVLAYLEKSEYLSCEPIRRVIRSYIGEQLYEGPIPRAYRAVLRPTLEEIFPQEQSIEERNDTIYRAHAVYGYKFAEIATHVPLCAVSVGRIYRKLRRRTDKAADVTCGGSPHM